MQQLFEPIFHVLYLFTIMTLGIKLFKRSRGSRNQSYFTLFSVMAILLGIGDAFHLLPRSYALLSTGLEDYTAALGIGKLVTSITATLFYVLFYEAWKIRFNKKNLKILDFLMVTLTAVRISLCLYPQNKWLTNSPQNSWEIIRNIPFLIIGLILIYILLYEGVKHKDRYFKQMAIAVLLSFLFYAPVVLFAADYPLVGMLMIPKTICYVWIIVIVYKELKLEIINKEGESHGRY